MSTTEHDSGLRYFLRTGTHQFRFVRPKATDNAHPKKQTAEMASLVLGCSIPEIFNGMASSPSNRSLKLCLFTENSVGRISFSRVAWPISLSRARSTPQPSDDEEDSKKSAAFSSPEDLRYLWNLLTGSTASAVFIKYGSVLVPEITRPDIVLALLMICLPVVMSVLLLINASSKEIEGRDRDSV